MTPAADRTEPALRGLFDHAGMFPPAHLALGPALRDAAAFPSRLHRPGIVGADLVLAWKDWPQLTEAALDEAGFAGRPCRVAVVGVPLADGPKVAAALAARNVEGTRTPVASLEVHAEGDLDAVLARATVTGARGIPVFLEPRWAPDRLRGQAEAVAGLLREQGAGLKVRCAGPTAVDRATLAAAVCAAADAGIALKATQGLHHPVPGPGSPHGFLGLLAAVRLRQARGAGFPHVEECLAERDPKAFVLTTGLAWRGQGLTAAQVARLPAFAIGSCSLTEPDDDLLHAYGAP